MRRGRRLGSDGSRELTLAIGDDAESASAFYGWWGEPRDTLLSAGDTLQANLMMHAWLRNVENVFLQAQEGVVDESVFNSYGFSSRMFETSAFRAYWEERSEVYNSGFVVAFERANGLE